MIYLRLFWEFFKAGLFAIGGGLATLPFLQEISASTGWFSEAQLADMIAVSECTPGPIGINMATYAGFLTKGVPGAVCSTLGLVTPSIIVILIVARILKKFQSNRYVQAAFYGLRPASTGLIAAACFSVMVIALFTKGTGEGFLAQFGAVRWHAVILAVVLWLLMNLGTLGKFKNNIVLKKISKLHPIVFLAASAVVGIIFKFAE
ncbi:MAG: chromate transporter [Firmicutes bacterium]|nr:chromate transporter [Bacillota bacterium]